MKRIALLLCVLLLLVFAANAYAGSVIYTRTINMSTTNWTQNLTIPKFDTTLGTLVSVSFDLKGDVQGTAKFESLDASPTTVEMDLQAMLKLQRPDHTTLVVTLPIVSTIDDVTTFDGYQDYGGTSGRTHTNLSGTKTESATTSLAGDLVLFSGTGDIVLPVVTTGISSGSGAGNLVQQFNTSAGAEATVTYNFTTVPEPSSVLSFMSGIVGITGLMIRRRK